MNIDWQHFTPWTSLGGGILIGIAAGLLILRATRFLALAASWVDYSNRGPGMPDGAFGSSLVCFWLRWRGEVSQRSRRRPSAAIPLCWR